MTQCGLGDDYYSLLVRYGTEHQISANGKTMNVSTRLFVERRVAFDDPNDERVIVAPEYSPHILGQHVLESHRRSDGIAGKPLLAFDDPAVQILGGKSHIQAVGQHLADGHRQGYDGCTLRRAQHLNLNSSERVGPIRTVCRDHSAYQVTYSATRHERPLSRLAACRMRTKKGSQRSPGHLGPGLGNDQSSSAAPRRLRYRNNLRLEGLRSSELSPCCD